LIYRIGKPVPPCNTIALGKRRQRRIEALLFGVLTALAFWGFLRLYAGVGACL
jgi:hypothetical protein